MKRKEVKVESITVKSQLIPKTLIGKNGTRHEITKVLLGSDMQSALAEQRRICI